MVIIRLRSHVDSPNRTRNWKLEFYIFIIHGTVSKRGSEWRQYLDLIRLRYIVDIPNRSRIRNIDINIFNGTVSKHCPLWRKYQNFFRLRSNMDCANHTRNY